MPNQSHLQAARVKLFCVAVPFLFLLQSCAYNSRPLELTQIASASTNAERLEIDATQIVKVFPRNPIGINLNYLMDSDRRRPGVRKSTSQAIAGLRPAYLRYPEGEQGDNYLWSVPPFDKPQPALARVGPHEWPSQDRRFIKEDGRIFEIAPLDFDEFMDLARAADAEPVVIICYDSIYQPKRPGTSVMPTREQLLETAREWVRYANKVKGYDVRYWEIGNETQEVSDENDGNPTAEQYAQDVIDFSRAMKSVDPSILVGASGKTEQWFRTVLSRVANDIDFLVPHAYPVHAWKNGYKDYLRATPQQLAGAVEPALRALNKVTSHDRDRIQVAVTETNVIDWGSPGWRSNNDLGHAIALFDLIGQLLKRQKTSMVLLWNTRWVHNDTNQPPQVTDALGPRNEILPSGLALGIWSRFLGDQMLHASDANRLRVFASQSTSRQDMRVFIINQESRHKTVELAVRHWRSRASVERWSLGGSGPNDLKPKWVNLPPLAFENGTAVADLTPTSINVLILKPAMAWFIP